MRKEEKIDNLLNFADEGVAFFKEGFDVILELNNKHKYNGIQLQISQCELDLNNLEAMRKEK